jgi:GT2 family glycosyltransferase/exopolysaccharide biosynthesis predicted pyruvyltransferase EpsI
MLPAQHLEHLQRSRQEIIRALGEYPDLVFVRGIGNIGDELIWAGTRRLLQDFVYREIDIEELPRATGPTVVICGGGAFCHPFHEFMPQVLAVAELRFERVIVLPSSFDTSVDAVRAALQRSRALIFAREQESYRLIRPLCDARIAHDCAFFFDYEPYRASGSGEGTLNAFRTDDEASGEHPLPSENDDISLTAGSLDAWLRRIAAHELIRTDRAHVMIAAAMLGKRVEFVPGSYFKVPAIAEYALGGFPVKRLEPAARTERAPVRLAPSTCSPEGKAMRERLRDRAALNPPPSIEHTRDLSSSPRVTAVILSHNRPGFVLGALHSLIEVTSLPVQIVVIDNNSAPRTRRILSEACAAHPEIDLHLSDRNLGCAGGRSLALEYVDTELVLFLDDDAELLPGALEHLVSELDLHPDVEAVTPLVVLPDGRVADTGGWYEESPEMVTFTSVAAGVQFDDPDLPPSGRCDWIPGQCLIRRSLFAQFPLDLGMSAYFEDTEWAYRVAKAKPDCFRRSRESLVLHHVDHKAGWRRDFAGLAGLVRLIATTAHFYRVHGRLFRVPGVDVFAMMPELTRTDETLDVVGARLVMELVNTHSTDWLLTEWMNGGLDPVLGVERTALGDELHACRTEVERLRGELAGAHAETQDARRQLEIERGGREALSTRLQAVYGSRLWRLGGSYDRTRRRVRRVLAPLRISPPGR